MRNCIKGVRNDGLTASCELFKHPRPIHKAGHQNAPRIGEFRQPTQWLQIASVRVVDTRAVIWIRQPRAGLAATGILPGWRTPSYQAPVYQAEVFGVPVRWTSGWPWPAVGAGSKPARHNTDLENCF